MNTNQKLPKTIDPFRLANQGIELQGELPLSQFQRLQDIADQANLTVSVYLKFDMNEVGIATIVGHLKAKVRFICQRCNYPFEKQIDSDVFLCPVITESHADRVQEPYEPLITHGELISLRDLVEDELLLNIPMVARHEVGECPAPI